MSSFAQLTVPTALLGDLLSEQRLARLQVKRGKTVDEIEEMTFLQDYLLDRNRREMKEAAQAT